MKNKSPDLVRFLVDLDTDYLDAVQANVNAFIEAEMLACAPQEFFRSWRYGIIVDTFDYMPTTVNYIVPIIRIVRPDDAGLTPEAVKQRFAGYLKLADGKAPLILIKSPHHD